MRSQRTTLGRLGKWGSGGTPLVSRREYYGGDIPWLTIDDLNDGIVEKAARTITQLGLGSSSASVVPPGTLLIAMYGSIGKLGITGMSCATNQAIAFCRCDPAVADVRYLFYLLMFERDQFVQAGRGGTQQNISQEFLKSYEVQLPDLGQQKRTAALLDEANHLRSARRYALHLSDSLLAVEFRGRFAERFATGTSRRLGEMVSITGGGTPSRARSDYFQGQVPWLTSKDMRGDYIWDTEEHITEEAIRHSATKLVPADSILVVVKSKVLMHRLPVAIAKVAMCHGQDIKSIQCLDGLNCEFARFVLKYHEPLLLNSARGANTEGLTLPMLEELSVPDADYAEQLQFAAVVHQQELLRTAQREALRQTEHLFQSLLRDAFAHKNDRAHS